MDASSFVDAKRHLAHRDAVRRASTTFAAAPKCSRLTVGHAAAVDGQAAAAVSISLAC
jgi:hypothetical protein